MDEALSRLVRSPQDQVEALTIRLGGSAKARECAGFIVGNPQYATMSIGDRKILVAAVRAQMAKQDATAKRKVKRRMQRAGRKANR